jgi:hypothetical protein
MPDTTPTSAAGTPDQPDAAYADVLAGGSREVELWGWSALAMLSLAVAGVYAVLVALSRIPGIEDVFPWPLDFFHKGLVVHVVLSFVVWFLAVFGALLQVTTLRLAAGSPRLDLLGMAAVLLAEGGCVFLFLPALMDRGEATLNNYVPVIIDPVYYTGLVLLAVALALAVIRLGANWDRRQHPLDPLSTAVAGGAVIFAVALICFATAAWLLGDQTPSHTFNEDLFWGGGHLLQFLNVAMLLGAWSLLAAQGPAAVAPRVWTAVTVLLLVPALAAPFSYALFDAFTAAQTETFTNFQYALAPPTLLAAVAMAVAAFRFRGRGGALPWQEPAFLCLALSILVFGTGGVLGLFVDGADTRTPGHYHGVIGGINLAFMGLFLTFFLPLLGRGVAWTRVIYLQIYFYAFGQVMQCLGLFLAGGYGAPRKTAGAEQGLEGIGAIAGMALNGIGALIAVIGGVLFIWTVGAALLRSQDRKS